MKPLKISSLIMLSVLAMALSSCQPKLTTFSYLFSMESVMNYKIILTIDSNKQYRIEKQRIFEDNSENKKEPIIVEGVLTDVQLDAFKVAIEKAKLDKMHDSYGFEEDAESNKDRDLIYQVNLETPDIQKYISIRQTHRKLFKQTFIDLLKLSSDFADKKLNH